MRPLALALVIALAAPGVRAQSAPAEQPPGDAPPSPASALDEPMPNPEAPEALQVGGVPAPVAPDEGRMLSDSGMLGVALLGGGAAVAASTASATALLEALSRNDLDPDAPPKNPELVQVSGFVIVTLLSLSTGVMLLGGALVAEDLSD